jgi:maltose/moltooligosaccharide transporter
VSAIFALFLPFLAQATSRKLTHLICLCLGGIGLISIYFIQDPRLVLVSMVGVGIAWASILSMPYAILAGALPAHRMGYFMGVFNFFIVIPQIVAGVLLDYFTNHLFNGEAIYTLVLGGCAMIVGGLLTLIVQDVDDLTPSH